MIKVIDFIGYAFFALFPKRNVDLGKIKSLCIINLGHIGDFVLSLPIIYRIKQSRPDLAISVAVLPQLFSFAKSFSFIDNVHEIGHKAYERCKESRYSELRQFSKISEDVVVETRGDIRILAPLKMYGKSNYLIGFDAGGGGFVLNRVMPYPLDGHAIDVYYELLTLFCISRADVVESFPLGEFPVKDYPVGFEKYIVFAPFSGASSKELDDDIMREFVRYIRQMAGMPIVVIGKTADEERAMKYDFTPEEGILNLINKTSMTETCGVVKNCCLFVGMDSGFTHIASLMSIHIFAIYSGMSNIHNWSPVPNRNLVHYIYNDVDCKNCGKFECSNKICMDMFTLDVLKEKFNSFYHTDLLNFKI